MKFLHDGSLDDLVLLALEHLSFVIEVYFVVGCVRRNYFGFVHMQRYWQNARQREVGVVDVLSVYFFILIEQVWIFELLDGFFGNLADPVIHPKSAILQNHLHEMVELVSLVVICLQVFKQLSHVFLVVHDLRRFSQIQSIDHHLRN